MSNWVSLGDAGEGRNCNTCGHKDVRGHSLGTPYNVGIPQYIGNDQHSFAREQACTNGCGYTKEASSVPGNCDYSGPTTTANDGVTVYAQCPGCLHNKVVHTHNLTESISKIEGDVYCHKFTVTCSCGYSNSYNVEHNWRPTGKINEYASPDKAEQYVCPACGSTKWGPQVTFINETSENSMQMDFSDIDNITVSFNEKPKKLVKIRNVSNNGNC